jgi:predicted negative regulator of RcsB-dependent stress response
MDADTRHQLKANTLAEALASLRDLKDARFLYSAGAVAVVLIVVLAWFGWRYSQQVAAERDWDRLNRIAVGLSAKDANVLTGAQNDLRAMLQEKIAPGVVDYARLELARSLVDQALTQPSSRQAAFTEAASVLEQIRSDPTAAPMLQAAATFMLASTYESTHQFDKAKELYTSLVDETRYAGSPYKLLAQDRLTNMDTLTAPIAFAPGEPPPPPPPPTQPVTLTPQMGPPTSQPGAPTPRMITLTPTPGGGLAPMPPGPAQQTPPQPPAPQPQPAPQPTPPPQPPPQTPPAPPG